MWENIVVVAIVLAAVAWFVRWIGKTRKGGGCSCGNCGKECAARDRGECC